MKAAGLFSGGKDSLYAIYLAEVQGAKIEHLICLVPSFRDFPFPHAENIKASKKIAEAMKKNFISVELVDLSKERIDSLKRLKISMWTRWLQATFLLKNIYLGLGKSAAELT